MLTAENPGANRLLGGLPTAVRARVALLTSVVDLPRGRVVIEAGAPVDWVYFPVSGLTSVVLFDAAGRGVEVAAVGREGELGVSSALASAAPLAEATQQIPGRALRLRSEAFLRVIDEEPALRGVIDRYAAARITEITVGTGCLRFHGSEARIARWLLTIGDRVESDRFPITQELLALMVGTTRPRVSVVLATLQESATVTHHRNSICILDRPALEARSCSCYGVVRDVMRRSVAGAEPAR